MSSVSSVLSHKSVEPSVVSWKVGCSQMGSNVQGRPLDVGATCGSITLTCLLESCSKHRFQSVQWRTFQWFPLLGEKFTQVLHGSSQCCSGWTLKVSAVMPVHHVCQCVQHLGSKIYILSRVKWLIDGYWIDNWIYWITHRYTQLQCIHLTTTESLLLLWRTRHQMLQPTLMASLAITH
jgi:hypothetical protein